MKHLGLIKKMAEVGKAETGVNVVVQAGDRLVFSRSRRFMTVVVKACIINLLYRHHGVSCTEIARHLGIHHSTVIHHLQAHSLRNGSEEAYHDVYKVMAADSQVDLPFMLNIESALKTIKNL